MIETKPSIAKGNNDYLESIRQKLGHGHSDKVESREAKKELGKDDFIKLMSVQLKYQDPLSPLKNEEMAAQLAQYSGLEQMTNVNRNLEKMATSSGVRDNMMAASLIGKLVETDSAKFKLTEDRNATLSFDLPESIEKGTLSVVNSRGEVIRDLILEKSEKGEQQIKWDGRKESGINADVGDYSFRVTAYSKDGKIVEAKTSTTGTVSGIEFDKGKPILLVGDDKVYMDVVSRIIDPKNSIPQSNKDSKVDSVSSQSTVPPVVHSNEPVKEEPLSFPMGKAEENQIINDKADEAMVIDDRPPAIQNELASSEVSQDPISPIPIAGTNIWNPSKVGEE